MQSIPRFSPPVSTSGREKTRCGMLGSDATRKAFPSDEQRKSTYVTVKQGSQPEYGTSRRSPSAAPKSRLFPENETRQMTTAADRQYKRQKIKNANANTTLTNERAGAKREKWTRQTGIEQPARPPSAGGKWRLILPPRYLPRLTRPTNPRIRDFSTEKPAGSRTEREATQGPALACPHFGFAQCETPC